MAAENDRRNLAAQRPGHGTLMPLPESPTGPSVGKYGVAGPAVGEGLTMAPGASEAQVASYTVPCYADQVVGGAGFQAGRQEAPIRVLVRSRPRAGDGLVIVSPQTPRRNNLWSRLLGKRRGR